MNWQNISKKNIYFFFSNVCLFNSQATSLDCGCKVTAFSETTKIFLCFFWKFFVTRYILRRKNFIETLFLCFFTRFLCFFTLFFARKNMLKNIIFRVFGFFRVFYVKLIKKRRFLAPLFLNIYVLICVLYCINNKKLTSNFENFANV